ncbi:hypothetical protein A5844_000552 [Enterococcus sp. 10A9_DIV0425]|uniref:Uncharacterized protein n=1 Tax=Candidatus Enterococcus wittei TaxID=1987383 RepID=A0A2C9XQ60_9ENTE|nr:hypothetical protein [Enterococcus sp. 10A9_DIV0425]OTP12320.1 hypothetical protein A5844_000552 [Enterococcus sp. 10A9_DIV0425]THE11118.1 hypothetical protein E1H99_08925 [Enterococcus hirae]
MSKQKFMQKASRWVLTFICSLSLFAGMTLLVLKTTLFNQQFMEEAMQESNYVETITTEINERISDLGRGSNIPAEVLADTVPRAYVQKNVSHYIRSIYTDIPFLIEGTEEVKEKIQQKVEDYAKEKNYEITAQTQQSIDNLKNSAAQSFSDYIEIPYLLVYGKQVMGYSKTLTLMIFFSLTVTALMIIALIAIDTRFFHRALRYLSYAIGGAGLMLLALPLFVYLSKMIERIGINSKSLYHFLTTYLTDFIVTFIQWGIVLLVGSLIVWLLSEMLRRRKVKKRY